MFNALRPGKPVYAWGSLLSLLTVTVLLVLPAQKFPQPKLPFEAFLDKIVHVLLFAGMMLNFFLWLVHRPAVYIALAGGLIYGVLMEFVQKYWTVNRSFSVGDMVADAVGSALALWIYSRVLKKIKPL